MTSSPKDQLTPAPWLPKPDAPGVHLSAQQAEETQKLRQELNALRQEKAAMSQIIWNLVRQLEPAEEQLVVSSIASDPLWQVAFLSADEKNSDPTKVRILAGALVPITEGEKKRVVRFLRGTSKHMHEALTAFELPHPSDYVMRQIESHLKWDEEKKLWESVGAAPLAERALNILGIPKA